MRQARRSGGDERAILTAMIVDRVALGAIAAHWPKGGLFASKYANTVGSWCVQFYQQYSKPPGPAIERLFEGWAGSKQRDEATVGLIEQLLASLSRQYAKRRRESNSQFVIDLATKHFNRVRHLQLVESLQNDLDLGNDDEAAEKLANWGRVELGTGAGVDVMRDAHVWSSAFSDVSEPLIAYPSALGKFFGSSLQRDGFIAFIAPEKRGKSMWLLDLAWRAVTQRRRVAFFEVGDMSQNQVLTRWGQRAARLPRQPCTIQWPTAISHLQGERYATVTFKEKVFESGLSWQVAITACRRVMQKIVRSEDCYIRLSCHPNSSINVGGIKAILDGWVRQGWLPDVIVIDYADILAPPSNTIEGRDQINATWKQLRRLSQEMHCLVVTATQADAASYGQYLITMKNFSDDKRKHAHVTGTIGINQTEEERDEGLYRLNWVVRRDDEYNPRRCVHVASCLALAQPAVCSTF